MTSDFQEHEFLPSRPIVQQTELDELKTLDAKKAARATLRGQLNLEEWQEEQRRAFLLARIARQKPPVESNKQLATWHDEMTTDAHQWDESPMKGAT